MQPVIIIGGGPAAYGAALALGTEDIPFRLIREGPGRSRVSPRIINIPGAAAISGAMWQDVIASQAARFKPMEHVGRAIDLHYGRGEFTVNTLDHKVIQTDSAVILATGMRLEHDAQPQPRACNRMFVVGSGDAAVQCALGHAANGRMTTLVVRGKSLDGCTHYLLEELKTSDLQVLYEATAELRGTTVVITDKRTENGLEWTVGTGCVQTLIGAKPDIGWAGVAIDAKGFAITGQAQDFMTSRWGVFAAGDIRSGTIKRIAVAQGEGMAVGHTVARWLRSRV